MKDVALRLFQEIPDGHPLADIADTWIREIEEELEMLGEDYVGW